MCLELRKDSTSYTCTKMTLAKKKTSSEHIGLLNKY